jgi:pyruvate/oxaloacetate carboxyltransferase
MLFHKTFLASFSLLPLPVLSYHVHQSCVDKGIASLVRDGMAGAFEMVDSALSHLNQQQYDSDTANLVRRLFRAKRGQNLNDRRPMDKVSFIFSNINRYYRTEVPDRAQLPNTDLVCSSSPATGRNDFPKEFSRFNLCFTGHILR